MKKIMCIGEMLIDMIDIERQGLSKANQFKSVPGGASANVAIATSRLGSSVYFLGNLGEDTFGKALHQVLKENQVNTEFVDFSGSTTIAWVGLTQDGERSFEFMRGSDGHYTLSEGATSLIDSDTIIHFGSATAFLGGELEESYFELLRKGLEKKAYISFDPNYRDTLIHDHDDFELKSLYFIEHSDFVKMSEEELELVTHTDNIEEGLRFLSQKTDAVLCVTCGEKGSVIYNEGVIYKIESVKVEQIDSTGAGDAFVGAVLYQLSKNCMDYREIVRFANKAGAITASRIGAIPSLPTLAELAEIF